MAGEHIEPHIVSGACVCPCDKCLGFDRCICHDCVCGGTS